MSSHDLEKARQADCLGHATQRFHRLSLKLDVGAFGVWIELMPLLRIDFLAGQRFIRRFGGVRRRV